MMLNKQRINCLRYKIFNTKWQNAENSQLSYNYNAQISGTDNNSSITRLAKEQRQTAKQTKYK